VGKDASSQDGLRRMHFSPGAHAKNLTNPGNMGGVDQVIYGGCGDHVDVFGSGIGEKNAVLRASIVKENDEGQMSLRLIYDRLSTVSDPSPPPAFNSKNNNLRRIITVTPNNVYSHDGVKDDGMDGLVFDPGISSLIPSSLVLSNTFKQMDKVSDSERNLIYSNHDNALNHRLESEDDVQDEL